jgi:epoxyqueuosine reductase
MDSSSLTAALKEEALRLGFDLVGATTAEPPPSLEHFRRWLGDGFAGEMRYLAERLDAYSDPNRILDGVRGILMLGMNYRTVEPAGVRPGYAKVSRHAWGGEYHEIVRRRLHKLADFHRRLTPAARVRGVVDTAPLLERALAQRAGLGWIGKNTMLINRQYGSWLFLAALLTTEELSPGAAMMKTGTGTAIDGGSDSPTAKPLAEPVPVFIGPGRCGSCRACLDACPTGALVAPYRLDARKCLSYLTIEAHGKIPAEYRAACGDRLFGCDACQEACPWNHRTPLSAEPAFQPAAGMNPLALAELEGIDRAAFRRRFRHTPLWRARYAGILRNASIVAENQACVSSSDGPP